MVLSQVNSSSLYIRDLLQVELLTTEESGSVMLRPSGNKVAEADVRGWMKLTSIVLAYRVADVIGLLNEVQIPVPQKVQRRRFGMDRFPSVSILNIYSILLNFSFPGPVKTQ